MRRVLQITNYMYPNIGGIEQVARDISASLKTQDDVEQKIICFNSNASDGKYICRQGETVHDEVDGVEVIRCGCFAKISSQQLSAVFGRELKKVMDDFRPDIVIFQYPNPFEAHYLLKYRKRDFRLIVFWELDITKQKILGKLFHKQSLNLLKRADLILTSSPNYIEGSPYLRKFRDKCTPLPLCIPKDRLHPSENSLRLAEKLRAEYSGKTLCFAVGRHIPYKGFSYLIKAAKLLDPNRFSVCIGGSGELTEGLKREAEGCETVRFLGTLSHDELLAYYNACDIFCFSSVTKNEAFGLALAEAMYYSKPAVTFTIEGSGVNFVSLDGVTGIECPNGDPAAYAQAIRRLADDSALRREYGRNARKRAEDLFMFERFRDSLLKLL